MRTAVVTFELMAYFSGRTCSTWLHVHVLVHLVEPVFAVQLLLAPLQEAPRRLPLDAVRDGGEDDEEAEEALAVHGVRVDEAAEEDREDDPCVHDDGKHHRAERADGLKDENLANGVPDAENNHVHMHVWVVGEEVGKRVDLFGVYEGDQAEEQAEAVDHEHHVRGGAVPVAVEHAALPLPGERVKHQKKQEEH
eukprot:CAMPEP_0171617042 /NCGR_PEP_ID=MMETSP0990-20121206/13864_1 /TAXON_ID=483369 /ORGANISM="non described non described, Strain CCMP2098" /LENGTH=193 /DNA_ID=CAMNT_0012181477 /DNA_START=256 /DNA_END=837 /DNA_ORIENTATION=-